MQTEQAIPWTTTPELFGGLPESDCLRILSMASHRAVPAGELIFQADDPTMIFLLTEGRVKVTQVSEDGREIVLWLNVPGQMIGSLNRGGRTQSSTAKAMQTCKFLVWDLPAFETNLDRFPSLLGNFMSIAVRQMNELSCRICEVSTATARPRLARALIRLTAHIGRRVNDDFELDLTQETLAQMTAMDMYSLNRVLSEWKKERLVACHRKIIVVRDLPGLQRLCSNPVILPA